MLRTGLRRFRDPISGYKVVGTDLQFARARLSYRKRYIEEQIKAGHDLSPIARDHFQLELEALRIALDEIGRAIERGQNQ